MTHQRETIRLSLYAPIPVSHHVELSTLRLKRLLSYVQVHVVRDLTTGIVYAAAPQHVQYLTGSAPYPQGSQLVSTLRGQVDACVATAAYGEFSRAQTELTLIIQAPDVAPDRYRVLSPRHARLVVTDQALEQMWPNGALHRIAWDEEFQVVAHRSSAGEHHPSLDVHIRLQQHREGVALQVIALTLALEPTPQLLLLPIKTAFLPRIEGDEASWLITAIRYYAKHHNTQMPM